MPRGVSKDLANFKETLEKGVILVGGEVVDNSIDPEDDTPVSVAIIVNVTGYGPHIGVICAVQGHVDEALQEGYEILEEWEMDHNPDYFKELEKEYGESASEVFTETFDGIMWELSPEDFIAAIKGTPAEKLIDVVEYEEEEGEVDEDDDKDYSVCDYDSGETLDGEPSEDLIEESLKIDTGAVPAYQDADGVWQYVSPSEVDFYRRQHKEEVLTVYVEEI